MNKELNRKVFAQNTGTTFSFQTLSSTEVHFTTGQIYPIFPIFTLRSNTGHQAQTNMTKYNRAVPLRFTYGVPGVFGERGKGGVAEVNEA